MTETADPARLVPAPWEIVPDRSPRRLLQLVRAAVLLIWRAARLHFIVFIALQVVSSAAIGASLLVIRSLVTNLLLASSGRVGLGATLGQVLLLAGVLTAVACTAGVQRQVQLVLSELVAWEASERVFDVAVGVELEAFDHPEFHDRLKRANAQSHDRPLQMTGSLLGLLGSGTTLVGVTVALVVLQPLLLPVLLVSLLPLWLSMAASSREFYDFTVRFSVNGRKRAYVADLLTGRTQAKEIRAFGLSRYLRAMNRVLFDERLTDLRALARKGMGRAIAGGLGSSAPVAVTVGLLAYLVTQGRMTVPEATAGTAAVLQAGPLLAQLSNQIGQLYESALFMGDYQAFCDLGRHLPPQREAAPAQCDLAAASLENVTFAYAGDERPAVRSVSLTVARGEVVALVGENGSGKSTLAKLLCGLYRPAEGRVMWDGIDAGTIDSAVLRSSAAVIFQDFGQYLFSARVNIGLGRPERMDDMDAIVTAAKRAGADELISRLPNGYRTMLGQVFEVGGDLSIGQWQRLALARAFFRDAPLIILDEPTASLDARAEHELFEGMRRLFSERAVLLVSHRFSSVRMADRIYVLREGEVVERGTHADLMALCGLYAEMFNLQATAFLEPGRPRS
jgi:ATP-binding cassette subfamily B protein